MSRFLAWQVRHTPEGADDYKICDTYDTRKEAVARLIEWHLRWEQMPDPHGGSLTITLTYVDGVPLIVVPGFGFYTIACVAV